MEATGELRSIDRGGDLCSETKIIQDFITHVNLTDDSHQEQQEEDHDSVDNHEDDYDEEEEEEEDDDNEEEEDDDDDDEEEEFTFMFEGANTPSMGAEDLKQIFPLFNRDLFFSGEGFEPKPSQENLPTKLPVKKVFVETDKRSDEVHLVTSATLGSDEVAGPFCEWSGSKAVGASSVACKKSNSTGFSKFWRFKDFVGRSSSDGKDTFVFLNKSPAPPPRATVKRRSREVGPPSPKAEIGKARRSGRGKTAPLSAHAVYLKNKAKQEDRRRSYLPYRPELMGFFTNGNVGLTRNVHPY